MKIMMIASEAAPYARTGGLGDVMGALPAALAEQGHDIKVVLPRYGCMDATGFKLQTILDNLTVSFKDTAFAATAHRDARTPSGVDYLFLENDELFGRPEFYVDPATGTDYVDNHVRFAFLAKGALELTGALGWRPDVIHAHDWQAALAVAYLRHRYSDDAELDRVKTVLTIHNLGYQGVFEGDSFADLDLPEELFYAAIGPLEFFKKVNFLKAGIALSDRVTTVSERYAEEIQSSDEYGCGLEGVLADRSADLTGIVNGVDYAVWSPRTDRNIPYRYWPANLSGKRMCKVELCNLAGLPSRPHHPLVGMVTRLATQKGLNLLLEAASELFAQDLQMVILGTGDEAIHRQLLELEQTYPDKLKLFLEFNDKLAHQIQAGADLFLMPSRYEPCGLNQMYAMKYGTIPVVRATGGLADTVSQFDPATGRGTGFVFEEYSADALLEAVAQVFPLYPKRQRWMKIMKNCMAQDFSWQVSAGRYIALYEAALADG